MQRHRSAPWLTLLSLFLFCLVPFCRAGDTRALGAFDGFWQMERKAWHDSGECVIDYQRFSSDPSLEGFTIAEDNVILGEWRDFFRKGFPSLNVEGETLELREGEKVVQRRALLDQDRMRPGFPASPEREPAEYRRIAEPVGGLRGGRESSCASVTGSWRHERGGGVLTGSLDRGELGLAGIAGEKPLPGKLILQGTHVMKDEGPLFLFFLRHPGEPVVLYLDMRNHDRAGAARAGLVCQGNQVEEIGHFIPTGP